VLKALFNIAHGLGGLLGPSWAVILETFERLDLALWIHHALAGAEAADTEVQVDTEAGVVESMLANLFDSSRFLTDDALKYMVLGLSQLCFANLAQISTASPAKPRPVRCVARGEPPSCHVS
jgi:hypothetical protein